MLRLQSQIKMEYEGLVYTLDEALAALGFGNFQGLVLAYAGLGWFAEAMEIMLLSFVGPAVKSEWGLSLSEESLLTTVVFVGMLVGAYSWGLISDSYGRRKGFLGIAIITTGGGFISSFSPNYSTLVILRCLVGIGVGGGHVFLSWFLEFVPSSNRGMWMVVFSTFWTLGTIFEALLAWIVMPILNWRWLFALSSIPSFVVLIFYGFTPESPRYLCMKGKVADARYVLEKMSLLNRAELPSGMLVSDRTTRLDEECVSQEDAFLLSTKEKTMEFKSGFSSFYMLFSSKLIRTTFLLWLLYFGNSFSYYGIILLTSELSSGQSKCGSTILHSKIFQGDSLYLSVFVTSLAELPGLLLSALIVDRVGRKLSMAIMFILGCIFLLPLVSHQGEILTTLLLFGARMCTLGCFTVTCIYAPELYPTSVRTTGTGVATGMGRIGGMICPLVAIGLVTGCHQTSAVVLFEVVLILSALCVLLFPFETKGQALSDTVALSKVTVIE